MAYETLYLLINLCVVPAWLLLFFAPQANLTRTLVHSGIYPVAYGLLYGFFFVHGIFFGASADGAGMSTAAGVSAFFSHPNGVLIGWLHYLVFDLFVGAWIARDSARKGLSQWKVLPCLFFALMFGPIGLLLYMLVRKISGQGFLLDEAVEAENA